MKHYWRAIALILMFFACSAAPAWTATRYVTDQLVVSLRQTPQGGAEVIGYLRTDTPLEIIEEAGDYLKVKTRDGEVGYVQQQYLTDQTPKPVVISRLEKDVARLNARIKDMEKDLGMATSQGEEAQQKIVAELRAAKEKATTLQGEYDRTSRELAQVSKEYEALQTNAKNVVALTQERDSLQETNQSLTAKLAKLEAERDSLLKTGAIKWFFTGAGVLLIGWILGKLSGGRRRRSAF